MAFEDIKHPYVLRVLKKDGKSLETLTHAYCSPPNDDFELRCGLIIAVLACNGKH